MSWGVLFSAIKRHALPVIFTISAIFTLLLALLWSPLTPERNIWYMVHYVYPRVTNRVYLLFVAYRQVLFLFFWKQLPADAGGGVDEKDEVTGS